MTPAAPQRKKKDKGVPLKDINPSTHHQSDSSITAGARSGLIGPLGSLTAVLLALVVWFLSPQYSRPHDHPEAMQVDRGRCNIDIMEASDFTPETFTRDYYLQKPVLIRTGSSAASGQEHPNPLWNRDYLVSKYGGSRIAVASSRTITELQGSAKSTVKLKNFLSAVEEQNMTDLFAFDRSSRQLPESPLQPERPLKSSTKNMITPITLPYA